MSNQSIVARGTMAISLVGAASLAMSAVAGANVVPGPHAAKTFSAAHTYGKQPFLSRSRRPNVGNHPPSLNIVLLGGGATLPAIAYVGVAGATGGSQPAGSTSGPSGANLVSAGSVLGYFDAHAPYPVNFLSGYSWLATYASTGSGFGKGVLNGSNPQPNPAPAIGVSALAGTNAFNGPDSPGDLADWAGSDAPVSQSEYTLMTAVGHYAGRGEFVQIPYVAGAVAIAFHNTDDKGNSLALTIPEIVGLAEGTITNWSQIPLSADYVGAAAGDYGAVVQKADPTKPVSTTNPGFPSKSIYFTFRKDNSGTTFSFTNFLSNQDSKFGLSQSFASAEPIGISGQSLTNFYGASGNAGVVSAIDGTDGSIGYAEAANALAAAPLHTYFSEVYTLPINVAAFRKDPIKDLPAAAGLILSLSKDEVVVYTNGNGNPGGVAVGNVTSSAPTSTTYGRPVPDVVAATGVYEPGALGIIDPLKYAKPVIGYPIVAVSNLEFYSSGNGVYSNALKFLASELYTTGVATGAGGAPGTVTTVDPHTAAVGTTGFSTLGVPSVFITSPYIGLERFIN